MDEVHVSLCGDKRIFPYLPVLIFSVLHNNPSTNIHFLHIDEIDATFLHRITNHFNSPKIDFIKLTPKEIGFTMPENAPSYWSHLPIEMYGRILIPNLLPNLDRMVYLDTDIIVSGDLSKLWNFDLEGNIIGMAKEKDYYQSGVLLMDLKKMREIKFEETLKRLNNRVPNIDQPLINENYVDQIKEIPIIFNFGRLLTDQNDVKYFDDLFLKEYFGEEYFNSIVIHHYAGFIKGWHEKSSQYFKYKEMMDNALRLK